MNVVSRKLLCTSAFALLAGAAATANAAPIDCTRTNELGERRACEAAAKGVADLRQFIQRTRGVYILYMRDFEGAVPAQTASAQERPVQPKAG